MSTLISALGRLRRLRALVVYGGVMTPAALCVAARSTADILRNATHAQNLGGGVDLFTLVDNLLGPALWIVVALAPLAIAWGAGAMVFGGRHGPQIMGSAIVAVVLVASAKGIAR